MGSRSKHRGACSSAERFRRDLLFRLEVVFLEVAGYLVDRWSFGSEHVIATFRGTKEPLSSEVLERVQVFLERECGALATGTLNFAEHWTGSPVDGKLPANVG